MRDAANATFVDEWPVALAGYVRKSKAGVVSTREAREELEHRLGSLQPVDMLVPFF